MIRGVRPSAADTVSAGLDTDQHATAQGSASAPAGRGSSTVTTVGTRHTRSAPARAVDYSRPVPIQSEPAKRQPTADTVAPATQPAAVPATAVSATAVPAAAVSAAAVAPAALHPARATPTDLVCKPKQWGSAGKQRELLGRGRGGRRGVSSQLALIGG